MKKSILAVAVLLLSSASAAFAEDKPAAPVADMSKVGPATRKVTKEDKKGIDALYLANVEAMKKGDVNAMADLVDFPVHMATDDHKGTYSSNDMTREQWIAVMTPFMHGPKDVKMSAKHSAHFLSDTLAIVIDDNTLTAGKQTSKWLSACTVINKDGKWLFKTMTEAGWGEMAQQNHAQAEPAHPATAAK